jgi:agmatine/peptidylarginine deiminase
MSKGVSYLIIIHCLIFMPVLLLAHQYQNEQWDIDFSRFTETPPPVAPVRPVAEFEPASQVLIRYPLGIPVSLVAQLADTAEVICLVASSSMQNAATNAFVKAGVNMDRVSFMLAATDSYWTRDYGPWFIFDGNGDLGVVDFPYNRPRPNDNLIPQVFATQQGLPYYGMNLVQTGGNYMTDGINTAAQTTLVYSEKSFLNSAGVFNRMQIIIGLKITMWYRSKNTYIDHIDCWVKFSAP